MKDREERGGGGGERRGREGGKNFGSCPGQVEEGQMASVLPDRQNLESGRSHACLQIVFRGTQMKVGSTLLLCWTFLLASN